MKDSGIVNGVGDGRFAPEMTVTRADFAVIADNAFQFDKKQDVEITLGGIAKGYLGDELLEITRTEGVTALFS